MYGPFVHPLYQLALHTSLPLLYCVSANVNEIHLRGGWHAGQRGDSDRIHGPTDEYNDRTQYVIDYVYTCVGLYVICGG